MNGVAAVVGIRVDVTSRIGAGHAMRCLSIAQALGRRAVEAVFFVSCEESADFFRAEGFECHVLVADETDLTRTDAVKLDSILKERGVGCVLVDSYGVDGGFFNAVGDGVLGKARVAYIDDMYTFRGGIIGTPLRRPVDVVVNFNIFADREAYRSVYLGGDTRLMLGPRYAPLRDEFRRRGEAPPLGADVTDVLVTTGSTNPSHILERLSALCLKSVAGARVHVVVGPKAQFDMPSSERVVVHKGASMAMLMGSCQMAIAAAGVTLLELAAMGVPTVAVGIVDNQYQDILVYESKGFGLGCFGRESDGAIAGKISGLYSDAALRESFSRRCTEEVDGKGADRIAAAMLELMKGAQ